MTWDDRTSHVYNMVLHETFTQVMCVLVPISGSIGLELTLVVHVDGSMWENEMAEERTPEHKPTL